VVQGRRPPALKAIVAVCSTDDRYADDVHYFGGAVLGIYMLGWSATMLATTALPPDPTRVGNWRELWQQRLDALARSSTPGWRTRNATATRQGDHRARGSSGRGRTCTRTSTADARPGRTRSPAASDRRG
jgi:predicted acyl esterase